jgi:hypothetical protein
MVRPERRGPRALPRIAGGLALLGTACSALAGCDPVTVA